MTGRNYILRNGGKCATIGARQMWSHLMEAYSIGALTGLRSDVRPHGERRSNRLCAFRGRCFVVGSTGSVAFAAPRSARSPLVGFESLRLHHKAPFFLPTNDARTQPGLHGLTRQETPSRDTPRAVRPNLAQVSVMLLVLRWITRPTDKANDPSRALGFFGIVLGPLAPNSLNSGAREALEPCSIHPRQRHPREVFA